MHPILEQIARIRTGETVRGDVLRRWQDAMPSIQSELNDVERLKAENAALRDEIATLKTKRMKPQAVTA
jgi:hypothetical protein